MKRLIDANALLVEPLHNVLNGVYFVGIKSGKEMECIRRCLVTMINNAPTVDAVEVVHGEWDVIIDDCTFDVIYQCSVCKEEFVTNDGTPAENLWHYCPNCGAKMD